MDDDSDSSIAGNDNETGPRPQMPPRKGDPASAPGGDLLLLRSEPDQALERLNVLMNDVYALAKDSIAGANCPVYELDEHEIYVKQSVSLTNCFTRLLAAADRHRDALEKRK